MRKQQLIQLLQFIIVWILIWCFVVFVEEKSFVEFLLRYRWYFLIVSVSYFYYYSIQYDLDKKHESIRYLLLYGNLYLFLHVFFRPLLNISHELFIILWLIILGIYRTTKMKSRRKYLLQILGWIFCFFILISGMIYLYPEKPDVDGFVGERYNQIFALWTTEIIPKNEAYIQIKETEMVNDFEITPTFTKVLRENCQVMYPSRDADRLEKIVIISPRGDVIWIFPQTEISLGFSGNDLVKISKVSWKIWFLSGFLDSDIKIEWNLEMLSENQQDWIQWVQDGYGYELVAYLRNQILEDNPYWLNNTIMRDVEGTVINILVKIFPATFSKNLQNFNEYQKYFTKYGDKLNTTSFVQKMNFKYEWPSFWENLVNNIKIGKWNVYDIFKVYK